MQILFEIEFLISGSKLADENVKFTTMTTITTTTTTTEYGQILIFVLWHREAYNYKCPRIMLMHFKLSLVTVLYYNNCGQIKSKIGTL